MKKLTVLFLTVVMIAAAFTGCGCRNTQPATTAPTTMPMATTVPTTQPTETTQSTLSTTPATRETIEDGNGPLPTNATAGPDGDTSSATETTVPENATRTMPRRGEK